RSTAPHRVPAVEALVASPAPHRDAPAHVARRGVGLQLGALLAQGVGDDGQPEVRGGGGGGADFGGDGGGAVQVAQRIVRQGGLLGQAAVVVGVVVVEALGGVGLEARAVAVAFLFLCLRPWKGRTPTPALPRSTGRGGNCLCA